MSKLLLTHVYIWNGVRIEKKYIDRYIDDTSDIQIIVVLFDPKYIVYGKHA